MRSSPDVTLRIDSLQWPVTVLGYGARIGIWLQGCSIGCPGCCAKHTWDADAGKSVALSDLLAWVRRLPLGEVDGVTITGGEPFEQPEALGRLVDALRHGVDFGREVDLLCYSGYPWPRLARRHRDLLRRLDAVVAGPYVERLSPGWLRGSSNQTLHLLSSLGRERYGDATGRARRQRNALQIVASEDGIRIVGIPDRGDLERMTDTLAEHGVTLGDRSW